MSPTYACRHRFALAVAVLMTCSVACAAAQGAADLETGFHQPPPEARPWVYWFWLSGNITREGITADLEAMQRVGVGGVLIMEVDQGAPLGPVDFMSPKWRELFQHVVAEAGRLGLEVNMNNDAGWNGSGGPWIKPEQSMQKVVWSETELTGPKHSQSDLPQPETVAGFYRDVAVLAFPTCGSFRIDQIRAKALYQAAHVGPPAQKDLPAEMRIDRAQIVDLTRQMNDKGHLDWDVPEGRWTVLRIGHTSTGAVNAPAPPSGRGLECDKLSREGVEANFNGMMAKLIADVGASAGKSLAATHVDSWENGSQNWTAKMREEFLARRGYDPLPFLPAMTGRVIQSLEVSERFLWDLRKTVSELVVENYAGRLHQLAHEHGLRFTIEAYGSPCDCLPYAGQCDEPMGEFWVGGMALETCKGMASAGHVYGKRIIGAEAFTAADQERWQAHPAAIKTLGDQAFCEGINRFVVHRYAMQPWLDRRPGMTMGPWGVHYERTQTWWQLTPPWHTYLARCQFLLRQGNFVADICYLDPEGSPQGFQNHRRHGYDWDECSPDVVLTRMKVKDGRLVLPDGMSYRVLVLPDSPAMTPPLLRRIKELVQAGATVIGPRPGRSPSLAGYPTCDAEVKQLADELWGDCDGKSKHEHRFGQGRIVCGIAPEEVLKQSGVQPDFSSPALLGFIHRDLGDTQLYFVANPRPNATNVAVTFRVGDNTPELWWPDSGRIEPAAVFSQKDGLTRVLLPLGPSGSVFVVFRDGPPSADSVVGLARDGKPLFSVLQPAAKIVVRKAVYGVQGDPQRTRDVRQQVQRCVDNGEQTLAVSDMAKDGDPAFGTVKTLVVEYTAGEDQHTVKASDGATVHLSPDAVQIKVDKAVYGVLGDAQRTRDVRDKVQQIADAGQSRFQVAQLAAGDDPAFGIVKTLVLEYMLGQQRITARGIDPETILLGSQPAWDQPLADVSCDPNGQMRLQAWQPGTYAVSMASGATHDVAIPTLPSPLDVAGPWELSFPNDSGAPPRVTLDQLVAWNKHRDDGVKYFSGTATYQTSFNVPRDMLGDNRRALLDLGVVQAIAEVKLNGKQLGVLWKPPFRADVTDLLVPGENRLEVHVTNLWPNRMIGDEHLPEDSQRNPNGTLKQWPQWLLDGKPSPTGRYTFTTWRLWSKDSPLLESGLLGLVAIRWSAVKEVPAVK